MADEGDDWHWVDAEGVQSTLDEWELVSSLSSGTLPPYTLVWRSGWAEWQVACQVEELRQAIPKNAVEPAVTPRKDGRTTPPDPPLERYAAYKTRAAAKLVSGGRKRTLSAAPPPPPGKIAPAGARKTPAPPVPVRRPPMPTLLEAPARAPATATLRPPGAVPPPPRGVPRRIASDPSIRDMDGPPAEAVELPTLRRATDAPLTPPPPAAAPSSDKTWLGLSALALAVLGALGAAVVVAGLWMWKSRDRTVSPTDKADAAPVIIENKPCVPLRDARQLASEIHRAIPPFFASPKDSDRVAVGFAASDQEAVGLLIHPANLAAVERFRDKRSTNITGVVPLTETGALRFQVDTEGGPLRFARTVNASPPFTVGVHGKGFARVAEAGKPVEIWPDAGGTQLTEPRVATTDGQGLAVTYRVGGQSGAVRVGWLDASGKARGELGRVNSGTQFVGTPTVAANDREILVVFAGRDSADEYWRTRLATAAFGQLPGPATEFRIPPGGPGAEAISPAAAGLPGGRWLVQWTEGSSGNRQVRVQTLASDLIPVGDPITVSPEGANAGQGVVWVRGDVALAMFLVKREKGHELWGAALKCP